MNLTHPQDFGIIEETTTDRKDLATIHSNR
jgi:hypothetical protein